MSSYKMKLSFKFHVDMIQSYNVCLVKVYTYCHVFQSKKNVYKGCKDFF